MVDLWVLHINSLRRTFDQSLMKIFQRVQEIESVTEGQMDRRMDRRTDEGHFYNPHCVLYLNEQGSLNDRYMTPAAE